MLKFILIIVVFFNLFLSFYVISQNRKYWNNRFFFLLSFFAAIWTLTNYLTGIYPLPFWLQSTYAFGALVIGAGLIWTFFLTDKFLDWKKVALISFIAILFFISSYWNGFIAKKYEQIYLGGAFTGESGFGLAIYTLFFLISAILILYKLLSARKKEVDEKIKKRLLYVFYGALVSLIISSLTSFILPLFSIFSFAGLDSIGFLIFLSFIAYAITKHGLFNIKVIATELLVFVVWVFLLARTLLAEGWRERIVDASLLILVIIFGILIIRSVLKEVSQKEKFKDLSEELEKLNFQLQRKTIYLTALQDFTADITRSLDYKIIIQKIVDEIPARLGYVAALLFMISEDGEKIFMSAISSNQATRIGLRLLPKPASEYFAKMKEDKILLIEAVNKNSIQISDRFSDFISPPVPKTIVDVIQKTVGIKSAVGAPIKSGEKTLGAIAILSNKEKESISQDELEVMQALASQVGIVLKNAALYEQIKTANEKLIEIDKMKAGMYSFVSHQIKAPIGIVKGFAQLISEGSYGKIPKKVKETVDNIKKSADRLIQLVEDFLDLRRIEEGKMDFKFVDVNIVDLIKSVVDELRLLAENKGLKLSFEPTQKEIKVKMDEQRMRQVIQNLIENSIKYTEKGFINVKIEVKSEKGIGNSILFSVMDSGMGIKPEVLPELFDQFTRAKEARAIKGTGLGLYIAREIVKAHKGEIWAESEGEGKGSRFYVRLGIV